MTAPDLWQWWSDVEPELLRLATRYTTSRDAAKDLVQDVAVLAVQREGSFVGQEEFRRWARARVRWFALDYLRFQRRFAADLPETAAMTGDHLQLEANEIMAAVNALPGRQQQVIRSTLVGHDVRTIAGALGIEEATVRSLQRFARLRIRRILEKQETG